MVKLSRLKLRFYSSEWVFLFAKNNEVMKDVYGSIFGLKEREFKKLLSSTVEFAFVRKDASMPDRLEFLALNALAFYIKLLQVLGGWLNETEGVLLLIK